MIFRSSRKEVKKGVRKMDGIITGLIIGGAAASIFGLSRTKKGKRVTEKFFDLGKNGFLYGYAVFGKSLAQTLDFLFQKK